MKMQKTTKFIISFATVALLAGGVVASNQLHADNVAPTMSKTAAAKLNKDAKLEHQISLMEQQSKAQNAYDGVLNREAAAAAQQVAQQKQQQVQHDQAVAQQQAAAQEQSQASSSSSSATASSTAANYTGSQASSSEQSGSNSGNYTASASHSTGATQSYSQPAAQPQTTSGFNFSGHHFGIAAFSGVGHVPADNNVYAWTALPNYYLVERTGVAGAYIWGLGYGSAVTVNGRVWHVQKIVHGVPNDQSGFDIAQSNLSTYGMAIQTCETGSENSTLTMFFLS